MNFTSKPSQGPGRTPPTRVSARAAAFAVLLFATHASAQDRGARQAAQDHAPPPVSCLYMTPLAPESGEPAYARAMNDEVSYELHALAPTGQPDQGAASTPVKWPEDRVHWMFIRVGGSHVNLQECPHDTDPLRSQPLALDGLGAGMIGLRLEPRVSEVPADSLRAWLEAHTLPGADGVALSAPLTQALATPEGDEPRPIRLRTLECVQTVVRSLDPDDQTFAAASSPAVLSKTGLRCEIRLNFDPTAFVLPTDIGVRAYIDQEGAKFQTLVVCPLTDATDPATWTRVRCDDKGIANISLDKPGPWLVRLVAARPSIDSAADIDMLTATITFQAGHAALGGAAPTQPTGSQGDRE